MYIIEQNVILGWILEEIKEIKHLKLESVIQNC